MTMTPHDIRHKEFKRGLRGYVDSEVDEFLDEVTDAFERLTKEITLLTGRCEEQQVELERYHELEETLQQTVVAAQRSADELGAAAQRSADELKAASQQEAARVLAETEHAVRETLDRCRADRQGLEQEIVVLMTLEEELRSGCESLITAYLERLDEQDAAAQAGEQDAMVREAGQTALTAEELQPAAEAPVRTGETARPATQDDADRPAPLALLAATSGEEVPDAADSVGDDDAEPAESPQDSAPAPAHATKRPRLRLSLLRRRREADPGSPEGDQATEDGAGESGETLLAVVDGGAADAAAV